MGRALQHLTATSENWADIRKLIAHPLRLFLTFDGLVWTAAWVRLAEPLPLFIANRPVMPAVPCYQSNMPLELSRPADPLDNKLDPRIPLTEEVVGVALETFTDAIGLMVFFNNSFFAVYEKSVNLENVVSSVPSRFGGLRVQVTHNAISVSSGNTESSPNDGEVQEEQILPGSSIWVKGPHFGGPPLGKPRRGAKGTARLVPALVHGSSARAGLLIERPSGEVFLTTVSHLLVIHNDFINRGEKAYKLARTKPAVLGAKLHLDPAGEPVCVHRCSSRHE
jgi:hypothetical protein